MQLTRLWSAFVSSTCQTTPEYLPSLPMRSSPTPPDSVPKQTSRAAGSCAAATKSACSPSAAAGPAPPSGPRYRHSAVTGASIFISRSSSDPTTTRTQRSWHPSTTRWPPPPGLGRTTIALILSWHMKKPSSRPSS